MRRALPAWRSLGLLICGLTGAAGVLSFVGDMRPIRDWLSLTLGVIFGWQLLLNLGWAGVGLLITRRLFPSELPPLERLCLSAPVGVAAFAVSLFGLGALHLFRPAFAAALALAFVAAGAPALRRWWREVAEGSPPPVEEGHAATTVSMPSSTAASTATPSSTAFATATGAGPRLLTAAVITFGVLGIAAIYLGLLAPDTVNYDARWIHLTISQDYAREGRLISFPGDWQRCYAHLGSILHTWDFLVPGLDGPPTRWMMALHTELALFLWTLAGTGACVRWLVDRQRLRGAWAAFFLFPGFFVYDSNMAGAADHVLAFFVPALFLLTVRLPEQRSTRAFALWGVVAGAAFITKYQAIYFLGPMALLLAWRLLRTAARPERSMTGSRTRGTGWTAVFRARIAPAAGYAVLAFAVTTAPHFLKNIVYHRNPVYPLMQDWFRGSRPTVPDGALFVRHLLTDWNFKAPSPLGKRIPAALGLLFTFSFKPHYASLAPLPTFGFLFTLCLPMLLFLRQTRRLWMAALVSLGAVFCWAFTYWVDRNLQIVLPLLVATTAAILVRAWQSGRLARVGVAALVLVQVVWGADLWFERTGASISLIRSTLENRGPTRFAGVSADYIELGRALPKNAVLLVHHWHPTLGIDRRVYLDWAGFQGSVDYRRFSNARDFYDRLRRLGVTHVVHIPGEQAGSFKQEDVIFNTLAINYGGPKTRIGMFEMFPLPATPPPQRGPLQVLTMGLYGNVDGLYDVTALGTCRFLPPEHQHYAGPRVLPGPEGVDGLATGSDAVLIASGVAVPPALTERLARDFQAAAPYPGLSVYIRKLTSPP